MARCRGQGDVKTRKLKATWNKQRYTASSLKGPTLPTKPRRTTLALVGKAYMVAGQAGACLHAMALSQA